MFRTHKDSKPNGIVMCNKLAVQFDEFQGICNNIWLNIFEKQFLIFKIMYQPYLFELARFCYGIFLSKVLFCLHLVEQSVI